MNNQHLRNTRYFMNVGKPTTNGRARELASEKSHWIRAEGDGDEPKCFVNPWNSACVLGFPELFRAMLYHKFLSGNSQKPDVATSTVSVAKPIFLPSRNTPSLRATWLGHACYYIEFPSGLRVLFDPVFEDRCSPVSWLGHNRFTPAPCAISDIPIVDCVIISHNHYDHLSQPSVMEILRCHRSALFLVPKGLKKWFSDCGISNAVELDWWEEVSITLSTPAGGEQVPKIDEDVQATVYCLPCQHTSARTPFDKATTLWASWAVSSGQKSVYFAGDTGYRAVPLLHKDVDDWGPDLRHLPVCPAFKQIGDLQGPFDLGLIPIGAYLPRHILSSIHSNPFDAVEIFKDTRCKKALAMHWGTWAVAEENVMEPPQLLREALERSEIPETGTFDVCGVGESREV